MLWAALDCAISAVNDLGLEGPAARWILLRDRLRDEIGAKGLNRKRNTYQYQGSAGVDGLPAGENPFLACSFWLVEQYANSARLDDARALMRRLLGFANDVGLLSEEYDVGNSRQDGNTPQALTHLTLVRAADAIAKAGARVNGNSGLDAAGMR